VIWSDRVRDAASLAFTLHQGQMRKASGIPYIAHLWAVAALVAEHGGDEDQVIAAFLHDAVEDQGGAETAARIEREFGSRVLDLVRGCSDTDQTPKPPWRPRKEAHIAHVRTATPELKLLIAADKRHNLQSILRDLKREGIATLDRFNGGRVGTVWYYQAMLAALATDWEHPILDELKTGVDALTRATA
jgi:(p)ppGpp synthase/HD superfamily hydrolase